MQKLSYNDLCNTFSIYGKDGLLSDISEYGITYKKGKSEKHLDEFIEKYNTLELESSKANQSEYGSHILYLHDEFRKLYSSKCLVDNKVDDPTDEYYTEDGYCYISDGVYIQDGVWMSE